MSQPTPPDVSPEMEPRPTAIHDTGRAPARAGAGFGVHAFVVSAYEANHVELFAFLARATRDRSLAEQLLQEAFVRLTNEARAGRAPAEARAWLFHTATSLVTGSARRQASALRWLGRGGRSEHDELSAPSPEAGVLSRERAMEMERVLGGLSPDARLALLLSGQGFRGDEIAAALGRTTAATRTLLSRARSRVRIRRDLFAEDAR